MEGPITDVPLKLTTSCDAERNLETVMGDWGMKTGEPGTFGVGQVSTTAGNKDVSGWSGLPVDVVGAEARQEWADEE